MIINYSPDSKEKLIELKQYLFTAFGESTEKKVLRQIINEINLLKDNPELGPSVEELCQLPTPYRILRINQNYIFYRIDSDTIYIVDIYNEKENFMQSLFGISLRTDESRNFWGN